MEALIQSLIRFFIDWGYPGLFISSFIAGSVIPFSSEFVMLMLIQLGLNPFSCVLTATIGNTMGGVTCFWIGRLGRMEWIEKYLRVKKEKVEKMQIWLQGKGAMMAFFAFLPIIGSVMVVALGVMRSNIWITTFSMLTGKLIRYIIILISFQYGLEWLMSIYPEISPILNSIRMI